MISPVDRAAPYGIERIVSGCALLFAFGCGGPEQAVPDGGAPAPVEVIVSDEAELFAVDGGNVYYAAFRGGDLERASVATGDSVVVVSTGAEQLTSITVAGGAVYWIEDKRRIRASTATGEGLRVVAAVSGLDRASSGGGYLYWPNGGSSPGLSRAWIGGGLDAVVTEDSVAMGVTAFSADDDLYVRYDGDCSIFERGWAEPDRLVTSTCYSSFRPLGDSLYVIDGEGWSLLERVSKANGSATLLAEGESVIRVWAVGRDHVYWVRNGLEIVRVSVDGGSSDPVAQADAEVTDLEVDGAFVYWSTHSGIYRLDVGELDL